jgi:hypothetical protein
MDDIDSGSIGLAQESSMFLSMTGTVRKVGCEQYPFDPRTVISHGPCLALAAGCVG